MALSTGTLTFDLADHLGVDFDARRTKVTLTTNVPGDTLVDKAANKVRLGGGKVTVNVDGTGSAVVWLPGADGNPTSWQTYVHVDYPDTGSRERRVRTFGPFTINATADLADLIVEQEVPPTYLSQVTADLDAIGAAAAAGALSARAGAETARDEAEAAAALARDISEIEVPDDVVKVLINDPESETSAALSATVERIAPRAANTFICAGDSLSTFFEGGSTASWPKMIQAYTDGRARQLRYAGVSGNTSAQLLARLETDVIAYEPAVVPVWIGTNDVSQAVDFATYRANVEAIHDALRAAGIVSVVVTIPPRIGGTTQQDALIVQWNGWLKHFAYTTKRPLWDFYSVLVDPATGDYRTEYTSDNIHLTPLSHTLLAQYAAERIVELMPAFEPLRLASNVDQLNMASNGLFLVRPFVVPTDWNLGGDATTGFTEQRVDDADFLGGKAWEIALDDTADGSRQLASNFLYLVPGQTYRFIARVKITASAGNDASKGVALVCLFPGTTYTVEYVLQGHNAPNSDGLFWRDITVPAGSSDLSQFVLSVGATAGVGSIAARFGEVGVLNLANAGIAGAE